MTLMWMVNTVASHTLRTSLVVLLTTAILPLVALVVLKFNSWYLEPRLKEGQAPLPPGDLGLPIFGNMLQFLSAFKRGNPQSFIGKYIDRYKRTGLYKAYMFGQPTVLATTPEACKFVLMSDDLFRNGWPKTTAELMGKKSFTVLEKEEHRRLRKLTAATINGPAALSNFMPKLQELARQALEEWAQTAKPLPILIELRKMTFKMIADVFMGYAPGPKCNEVERNYRHLNYGIRAMPINLPGTAYNTALKCRRKLEVLFQEAINERRNVLKQLSLQGINKYRNDLLEMLIKVEDETDGRRLTDEEIMDLLIMYLNAGHESSAHTIMWILIFLRRHPASFDKVKKEQIEIRKSKKAGDIITFEDYRRMTYLSQVLSLDSVLSAPTVAHCPGPTKGSLLYRLLQYHLAVIQILHLQVVDETLRIVNISPMVFRQSIEDVEFNGYTIPKGWHVQTWMRQVHLDPEVYTDPFRFDPERWQKDIPKAGEFIPFGAGVHMCPGNDFAKMEIALFVHYAVLDYEFEQVWPNVPIVYLPHPRPKDYFVCNVRKSTTPTLFSSAPS